jgi:hypothetical protein
MHSRNVIPLFALTMRAKSVFKNTFDFGDKSHLFLDLHLGGRVMALALYTYDEKLCKTVQNCAKLCKTVQNCAKLCKTVQKSTKSHHHSASHEQLCRFLIRRHNNIITLCSYQQRRRILQQTSCAINNSSLVLSSRCILQVL